MSKVLHESRTETGLTRIVEDSNGNIRIDSYMGDEKDPKEHDRRSLNVSNNN